MTGASALKASAPPRSTAEARVRFGDCEISRQTHELWRQGQPQPIRRKAFDVLLLLIDQRPQTLGHERIAREVWGSRTPEPKHIARAVMEVRRAIGDDPESPRYILSVRGVGYRFAADVALADLGARLNLEAANTDGARAARGDIDAATACFRRGDFEEARRLVDRAIASADLAGARPELACALALAATILLRLGSREHALTLATKAMRIAQQEGRCDVLAEAQLGMAEVQIWTGSAHAALDHLQAAHAVLAPQGPSLTLWRCERVLSFTYRQLGRPEDAWQWCERAEASARLLEPETRAVHERLLKVAIIHYWMEVADAEGREDDLHTHGLKALELLDATEPDARVIDSSAFQMCSQTYRAQTLEAMGRVEEAWIVVEQLRPILFGAAVQVTPMLEFRRNEFRQTEASLLSRSGRALEAIQAVEKCIALACSISEWSMELASAQGLAARVFERAGRHKEALEWMRRQQRTTAKLHADRAQATSDIVRAQLESDRLGEELAQAHAEMQRLQQLNQELERRIVQMDRHPLLDEGGLVPAAALAATIDGRAALARERELPLCVGIVESFVTSDEDATERGLALRRRLKLLSSTLKAVIPEASAPAQWRPGLYFFIVSDLGLGPARQRCHALAHRMNGEVVPTTVPEPVLSFRADALDITHFAGIEAALGELRSVSRPLAKSD